MTELESLKSQLAEALMHDAGWKCFHCGENCKTREQAALHFGGTEREVPICTIDAAKYREMEERMHQYNEEDSELHRRMRGMECEHAVALRREEEKGYALGLDAYRDERDQALKQLHVLREVLKKSKLGFEAAHEQSDDAELKYGFENMMREIDKALSPAPIEGYVVCKDEPIYQYCPDHFQPELWIDGSKHNHDNPNDGEDFGFENKPYPRRIVYTKD